MAAWTRIELNHVTQQSCANTDLYMLDNSNCAHGWEINTIGHDRIIGSCYCSDYTYVSHFCPKIITGILVTKDILQL